MIKPIDYKQGDRKWGGLPYRAPGETSTIKSAGCGPTAMADVLAAIVSPYIDPVTCASWARQHGYKVLRSGTSYNYIIAQAEAYRVSVKRLHLTNVYNKPSHSVHAQALAELQAGNWLIACMGKGLWTSSGHYIVVYGYDAGKVYICDPASSKAARLCNTWELFKSQVKYYWAVDVPDSIRHGGAVKDGDYRQEDFIREVQMCTGSVLDGKAGSGTLASTVTVSAKKNRKHAVVLPLQKRLKHMGMYSGDLDQTAGPLFTAAVRSYQKEVLSAVQDGEITKGQRTWKALLGMAV